MRRPTLRSLAGGVAGIAAGVIAGLGLASVSAGHPRAAEPPASVEAAHVPPLLTLPGESIRLRYAIVCRPRDDGLPCDGAGDVYVRPNGRDVPFTRFPLQRDVESREGRYFVDVPAAPNGFSYYAVLRDEATAETTTVPAGGAAAPQRSVPLRNAVPVDLPAPEFSAPRAPGERVVAARWGDAVGELGLAGSPALGFVGPSSFDVATDGSVVVLDQVNGRVQRWLSGRAHATRLAGIGAGLADFAVERDGTMHVLEPPNRATPAPVVRSFRRDGTPTWSQRLADRTWAKLAIGPDGPVVQQQPSEQWLPVTRDGRPLTRRAQAANARMGLPLDRGRELLVEHVDTAELRIAEIAGAALLRGWRVRSPVPLGEVQLAEETAGRVVVVVKTYTGDRDAFVVLVLDGAGIVDRFAVESLQWAESAPLARFRLRGSSLYRLGTTPAGAFVDRFDLEVTR